MKTIRQFFLNRTSKKLSKVLSNLESELMDVVIIVLLKAFSMVFCLDKTFRKNIEGFNAVYAFKSEDGKIAVSAIFKDNKMKVKSSALPDANVTIILKNGKVLCDFALSGDPDIFNLVLTNRMSWEGNVNYLMKFAYMGMHLATLLKIQVTK
ncbi:MAG: hypothetical protein ACM3SY_20330 [Candidatus Omnitrophota bacterium]